jgi:hypothetical protein
MRCLVIVDNEGWAVLCTLTNKTQDINKIAGTQVYISLIPTYLSIPFSFCINLTASD